MIIGLTGTMSSGKGEVVKILKEKGYESYIFSDVIKEEAKKQGLKLTRENLQKVGNMIRNKEKPGYLAKKLIEKFKTDNVVVDGVRSSDEIRALREAGKFVLIGVDASQRLRFERLRKRGRKGDPTNFGDFKKLDDKENKSIGKGQEINKCLRMADFTIINDGSVADLRNKVGEVLGNI